MGKTLNVSGVEGAAAEADGAAHQRRQSQDSQQDGPPVSLQTTKICFIDSTEDNAELYSQSLLIGQISAPPPPLQSNCLISGKFHLHPLPEVVEVVQIEDGVLEPGDGSVGVQQATHVELIAVPLVLRARGAPHRRQQLLLKVAGQHGRGGAGARVRFVCQPRKNNKLKSIRNQLKCS